MTNDQMRKLIVGIVVLVAGFGFGAVTLPNTFMAGTPIIAAQVNDNFAALKNALETASGINAGAIGVAKLTVGGSIADGKVLKAQSGGLVWGDDATGALTAGAGLSLSGNVVSLADAGVSLARLATTNTAGDGQVLRASDGGLAWADDGLQLPFAASLTAASPAVIALAVTSPMGKTAIKGLGGNYGVVGDTVDPTGVGVLAANSGPAGGAALEVAGGLKVSGANKPAFVHRATMMNSLSNYTCFDNPLTTNRPNAILIVTQSFNPNGLPVAQGVYNDHSVGVFYGTDPGDPLAFNKWCLFNQNTLSAIPRNASFNVLVFNQ